MINLNNNKLCNHEDLSQLSYCSRIKLDQNFLIALILSLLLLHFKTFIHIRAIIIRVKSYRNIIQLY